MNLVIDQGNTRTKTGIFQDDELKASHHFEQFGNKDILHIFKIYPEIRSCLLSSVIKTDRAIIDYIKKHTSFFSELNAETLLPLKNYYKTTDTLGKDRIAAVAGANNIFPDQNVLVIDIGTAITFEFINNRGEYLGGNISPGVNIRFRALNNYTQNLPLVKVREKFDLIANNTEDALISGVLTGILFEIESYIIQFEEKYKRLKIILTGGDSFLFDKKLKSTIFVNLNLVLIGLNAILKFNLKR